MSAPTFPSIEQLLVGWLPANTGGVPASAELPHAFDDPTNTAFLLPVNFIDRISGADLLGSPILDRPIVDIDSFAADRATAQANAEAVRRALRWLLPGTLVAGCVFTRSRTVVGPRELPYSNSNVRRYVGTYELLYHPQQ